MKMVFRKISITILATVITGLSGINYVSAEDIVIFQRDSTIPNVLFVIDTSFSMDDRVNGSDRNNGNGPTRLDVMKDAFTSVLSQPYEALNVGFVNFEGNQGGGVDLPVTSVNQLAQDVEPGVADSTETYGELLIRGVDGFNSGESTPTVDALYEAALYFRGDAVFRGLQNAPHTSWNDGAARYMGGNVRSAGLRTYNNATLDTSAQGGWCLNEAVAVPGAHPRCDGRPLFENSAGANVCEDDYIVVQCDVATTCPDPLNSDGICPVPEVCEGTETDLGPFERCRLAASQSSGANYITPIQDPCTSNHIVLISDGKPTRLPDITKTRIRDLTNKGSCDNLRTLGIRDDEIIDTGECGLDLVEYLNTEDQSTATTGTNQAGLQTIKTHAIGFQLTAGSDEAIWLDEMAQVGGTGSFIDAGDPSALVTALQEIVNSAISDTPRIISRIATTPDLTNLGATRPEVYMPLFAVETNKPRWPGNLKGFLVDANGKLVDTSATPAPIFNADGSFATGTSSFWSSNDGGVINAGGLVGILPNPEDRNLLTDDGTGTLIDLEPGTAFNTNPANIFGTGADITSDRIDDLIDWVNGEDVFDEDGDTDTTKRNFVGDALHANPVVVSYDETDDDGVVDRVVTFFMTNEGILHAIDDEYFVNRSTNTAAEIFAFMPRELLSNIDRLEKNTDNTGKIYGLDGPLVFHQDGGIRNLAGNKYLYFGMRRGGNNYYAMNVTDPDNPVLMWTIKGGDTGFEELAQSWSTPIVTNVDVGGTVTKALIFGGGYDVDQDNTNTSTPDDEGRAIFIVDALSGDKIWSAGPVGATPAHNLELGMTNAVAADVAVVDFENDGLADRLYYGDVGGHIWRIDIQGNISVPANTSGYLFADLHDGTTAGNRRFFSRPTAAFTSRGTLAISIGSGNRVNPLQGADGVDRVTDRFYTLFDPNAAKADIPDPTDLPDAIVDSALQNLTGFSAGFDTSGLVGGWRVDLQTNEKVFNSPRVILGEIFFTTYIPPTNVCSADPDGSNLYVLSLDGEPTRDLDANPDGDLVAFTAIKTTGINGDLVITVGADGKVFGQTGNNDGLALIDNIKLDDLSWTNNPPPPPPPLVTP